MLRLLSIALMLASGSSFAPSLKTQLAARRPPPTPARAMPPDMAFQSPFKWHQNDVEEQQVCPHPLSVPFLDSCTRSLKDAPLAPLARAAPFHARQPPSMHDNPHTRQPPSMHDNPRPPGSPPQSFVCPPPTQASPRHLPSPPASHRGFKNRTSSAKNSERSSASPSGPSRPRLRPSCSRCDAESHAPPEACTWRVCTGGSVVRDSAPRLARRVLCAQCTCACRVVDDVVY